MHIIRIIQCVYLKKQGVVLHKFELNQEYLNFEDFLLNISDYFSANDSTIHKARNELKIILHDNLSSIVKSFKIPHLLNRIIYSFFKDSKAKKSYNYSLILKNFAPQPIGYIEFYSYGLLYDSYFVSEEFKYDFTIREPLLDENFEDREEVFRAFARFTFALHDNQIFHKDYSPGNILIKKEKEAYIFKIVDVNRMGFFELTQKQRAKNFSKLWAHDYILEIMAGEYIKHHICDINFIEDVLYYSNQNKKIKNFKKRLKGQEVND